MANSEVCLIVAPVTDQRNVTWEECEKRELEVATKLIEMWDIPDHIRDQLQLGTLVLNGIGIRKEY